MKTERFIAAGVLVWLCSLGLVLRAEHFDRQPDPHTLHRGRDNQKRGHDQHENWGHDKGRDRDHERQLNAKLARVLKEHGFTGRIESTLEDRLDRRIDKDLANLGRLLFFDKVHSLHVDNTCAGCHSPTNGFGDTQSIAIGVDNNGLVGPNRAGPRNQRRSPMVINTAFYPKLMWNGRFFANGLGNQLGDPFVNNYGFTFPAPEGGSLSYHKHLLQAQAFIPPTELVEVAGFTGTKGTLGEPFDVFDNGRGRRVPPPDHSGFRNDPIRNKSIAILNRTPGYRLMFGKVFPEIKAGGPVTFDHFGLAIAEFEFTLTFANAPIDKFARGQYEAMSDAEKRGALVFFGKGQCVTCHAVKGKANEMFSDFENHVIGVPQIAPYFGVGRSNMIFDGPGADEDFGAMQISGLEGDKYKFRTAPLRNIAVQPAFFHNGSFTTIEGAIRHHLDAVRSARKYDPKRAGLDRDLTRRPLGPIEPVLARLDARLARGIDLSESEIDDLTEFVTTGLLDRRALKENLCSFVPKFVPSGLPVLTFEACQSRRQGN